MITLEKRIQKPTLHTTIHALHTYNYVTGIYTYIYQFRNCMHNWQIKDAELTSEYISLIFSSVYFNTFHRRLLMKFHYCYTHFKYTCTLYFTSEHKYLAHYSSVSVSSVFKSIARIWIHIKMEFRRCSMSKNMLSPAAIKKSCRSTCRIHYNAICDNEPDKWALIYANDLISWH